MSSSTTPKEVAAVSNPSTSIAVVTKTPDVKADVKQKVVPPVLSLKNIYTNKSAEYSIAIPDGWVGKTVDTGNSKIYNTNFTDPSGKVTLDDAAFSVTATERNLQDDAYYKSYGKKPTNEDLVDMFISSQKDNTETQWALDDKNTVTINGMKGYVLTATYGNSDYPTYATTKYYLLFGSNYVYNISLNYKTSDAQSAYALYKPYVLTFLSK
ncbi:MAG: hypothetical protein WCO09_01555 [bacterium]